MRWRWVAISLGIGSLVLIGVGVQHIIMPPRTYQEAVMQVLDAQQITYDTVTVDSACPPSPHCFTSGTFVIPLTGYVTIDGPHPAYGQLSCPHKDSHGDWTDCVLSLPTLDIRRVPLPSLVRETPWLEWLKHEWHTLQE